MGRVSNGAAGRTTSMCASAPTTTMGASSCRCQLNTPEATPRTITSASTRLVLAGPYSVTRTNKSFPSERNSIARCAGADFVRLAGVAERTMPRTSTHRES